MMGVWARVTRQCFRGFVREAGTEVNQLACMHVTVRERDGIAKLTGGYGDPTMRTIPVSTCVAYMAGWSTKRGADWAVPCLTIELQLGHTVLEAYMCTFFEPE